MATTITETERDLLEQVRELEAGAEGRSFDDDERERWNDLNEQLDEFRKRRERLTELAGSSRHREDGTPFIEPAVVRVRGDEGAPRHVRAGHDAGLRAIERNTGALSADATRAAVVFVQHTGHAGDHMRGTSDLESVWESRLAFSRDGSTISISSAHREAEETEDVSYTLICPSARPTASH